MISCSESLLNLLVIDEASQVGLAYAAAIAPLARKVVFAGDPKQLSPVIKSSSPAARLWMGTSVFSQQVAQEYLAALNEKKTVGIVCPTWNELRQVTETVRGILREHRQLHEENHPFKILVNDHSTTAQRRNPKSYQVGDWVVFHRKVVQRLPDLSKEGMRKPSQTPKMWRTIFDSGEAVQVVGTSKTGLVVAGKSGEQVFLPQLCAKEFNRYQEKEIEIAVGEKLLLTGRQTRRKDQDRLVNKELVEVERIEQSVIHLKDGRWFDASRFRTWQHGYGTTAQTAQGKDYQVNLVVMGSQSVGAVNRAGFYVAISRGKETNRVFTDDRELISQTIHRTDERKSALQMVTETTVEESRLNPRDEMLERVNLPQSGKVKLQSGKAGRKKQEVAAQAKRPASKKTKSSKKARTKKSPQLELPIQTPGNDPIKHKDAANTIIRFGGETPAIVLTQTPITETAGVGQRKAEPKQPGPLEVQPQNVPLVEPTGKSRKPAKPNLREKVQKQIEQVKGLGAALLGQFQKSVKTVKTQLQPKPTAADKPLVQTKAAPQPVAPPLPQPPEIPAPVAEPPPPVKSLEEIWQSVKKELVETHRISPALLERLKREGRLSVTEDEKLRPAGQEHFFRFKVNPNLVTTETAIQLVIIAPDIFDALKAATEFENRFPYLPAEVLIAGSSADSARGLVGFALRNHQQPQVYYNFQREDREEWDRIGTDYPEAELRPYDPAWSIPRKSIHFYDPKSIADEVGRYVEVDVERLTQWAEEGRLFITDEVRHIGVGEMTSAVILIGENVNAPVGMQILHLSGRDVHHQYFNPVNKNLPLKGKDYEAFGQGVNLPPFWEIARDEPNLAVKQPSTSLQREVSPLNIVPSEPKPKRTR